MYQLTYQIRSVSPLIFPSQSGEPNTVHTLEYIPGSTILGALAAVYLSSSRGNGDSPIEDETFCSWFLNNELLFANAFYTETDEYGEDVEYHPAPLSLRKSKNDEDPDKVRILNFLPLDGQPDLSVETTAFRTYTHIGYELFQGRPRKKIHFHHARDSRMKGRSEEGNIFHYESLEENQLFTGKILGPEALMQSFAKWLQDDVKEIRLGRSKNTHYGFARLEIKELPRNCSRESVGKDISSSHGIQRVLLTCLSPIILLNEWGYPEANVEQLNRYLAELLEIPFQLTDRCYSAVQGIETFSGVWKMKKPLEHALVPGSTFMLEFKQQPEDLIAERLFQLKVQGIGERRHEGYGRIAFNAAPQKEYEIGEIDQSNPEKPAGEPLGMAKEILKQLMMSYLYRKVREEALLIEFQKLPANHLITRLERILESSDSPETFVSQLDQLSKDVQNKLKSCRNESNTLWQLLQNVKIIESFLSVRGDYPVDKPRPGSSEYKRLYRVYWQTMFEEMKRLNKREENHAT